jgi:hypothetical protein
MQHWSNATDRENPKYLEKNLSNYHVVNHKSYMNWSVSEPWLPRREAGEQLFVLAGRSGNRVPVGQDFLAPVQTGPGLHSTSCSVSTGSLPRG